MSVKDTFTISRNDPNMDTAIAGILGLSKKVTTLKTVHVNAVVNDSFDLDLYKDILYESEVMRNNVTKGEELVPNYPLLSEDIFMSLFKYMPILRSPGEVKRSSKLNHTIMTELMESEEYTKLRRYTKLDIYSSAMGHEIMGNRTCAKLEELIKKDKPNNQPGTPGNQPGGGQPGSQPGTGGGSGQTPGQGIATQPGGGGNGPGGIQQMITLEEAKELAEEQARQAQEQLKNAASGQDTTSLQQQLQDALDAAQQADQQLDQLSKDTTKDLKDVVDKINQTLKNAAKEATDELKEGNDILTTWGFGGNDSNNRISIDEKRAAIDRVRSSPKLRKFADLVGRLRDLAREDQKKKSKDGATIIESVKTGDDIHHVLPSELMKLAHKTTNKDVKRRLYQKELLQYEMNSNRIKAKGSMICCVDVSGSMIGDPEKWAKAMTIALLDIAQQQKRNFACILFDDKVREDNIFVIPYGELKPKTVLDIAEKFSGGGTDFNPPLKEALKIMQNSKFKDGDIVFITDGQSDVNEEFLKKFLKVKGDKGFSVRSIVISSNNYSMETLKEFSDETINITNLVEQQDEVADKIFMAV